MPGFLSKLWSLAKWKYLQRTRSTVTIPTEQGTMTVSTQDDVIGKLLYLNREYQLDTTTQVLEFLRAKSRIPARGQGVILDIGANIGIIAIGLLVQDELASAIAIEPDPTNFGLCQRNARQSGLSNRYHAFQVAASDKAGTIQLELSEDNFGDHRVKMTNDPMTNAATVSVEAATVDDILARVPESMRNELALVWIDVQGHEGYLFAGSPQLFTSGVPVVAEIWPFGIQRSGMTITRFCEIVTGYWQHYWAWIDGKYVQFPIANLIELCNDLERRNTFDDVIFMD